MCDWNRCLIEKLIESYKKHPCLYNNKHADYHVKRERQTALQQICVDLMKSQPNMSLTSNDVIKKFNSLRTVYGAELKKIKKSQRSTACVDDVYKPHVWWFPLMQFLEDHMQPRPSYSNVEEQMDSIVTESVSSTFIQ